MKLTRNLVRPLLLFVPALLVLAIGCGGSGGGSTTATGGTSGITTTTGTTATTSTTTTGSTGSGSFTVAYVSGTSANAQMLDIQQGLGTPMVVASGVNYFGPSLSPDKSTVAVIENPLGGGPADIFLFKTTGGLQTGTQLTHVGNVDGTILLQGPSIVWNPQGTKLLFDKTDFSIWEINANGGNLIQIAPGAASSGGYIILPRWSPDGSKIAFWQGTSLFVVNADGSNTQQLYTLPSGNNNGTTAGYQAAGVTWSSDSSMVYFMDFAQLSNQSPAITSFFYKIAPVAGSQPVLVTSQPDQAAPSISPSGSVVAYMSIASGTPAGVGFMNIDGSNTVSNSNGGTDYRWTNNNQVVLYDGHSTLQLISPTSSGETLVATLPSSVLYSGFDAR
ncbi:MAG: TolB family protein [Fimbriimonadaceae bacterium]